jgi:hypothetical protein
MKTPTRVLLCVASSSDSVWLLPGRDTAPARLLKGSGTCTYAIKGEDKGDKINMTWEEGSHLKEYTYKNTGGTGKYEGTGGGGTYKLEELTDTLLGGKYKGTIELP